ncbi:MAG: hypothetical protein LBJ08_10350 [Bifidobacteriaceae bacterium]|jgi:sec-independent protein translocase protein TatB|nr:hypothetical protein [Bifidobacteriaceae bacterium]
MEFFGISGSELAVLVVLIVLVSGPKGVTQLFALLKRALAGFRAWNARLRQGTNLSALASELRLDGATLDLRQYDPRSLVREAVREEMKAWTAHAAATAAATAPTQGPATGQPGPTRSAAATTSPAPPAEPQA